MPLLLAVTRSHCPAHRRNISREYLAGLKWSGLCPTCFIWGQSQAFSRAGWKRLSKVDADLGSDKLPLHCFNWWWIWFRIRLKGFETLSELRALIQARFCSQEFDHLTFTEKDVIVQVKLYLNALESAVDISWSAPMCLMGKNNKSIIQ